MDTHPSIYHVEDIHPNPYHNKQAGHQGLRKLWVSDEVSHGLRLKDVKRQTSSAVLSSLELIQIDPYFLLWFLIETTLLDLARPNSEEGGVH